MRKALSDTALVWIVVGLALIVQLLLAAGRPVPLIERSSVWQVASQPWTIGALASLGALTVALLVHGPGAVDRRARLVGWALGALAIACFVVFDPVTAVVVAATGRMVYTSGSPRPAGATAGKRTLGDVTRPPIR